jgi:hypothetical protein
MLVDHARHELVRAGLFDSDADYDGALGPAVLELVEVFARQGHSGASAAAVLELFTQCVRFRPLTPLTSEPTEWTEVRPGLWQSCRQSDAFSRDGGRTWYVL